MTSSRSTLGNYLKLGDVGLITATSKLAKKVYTGVGHAETAAAVQWLNEEQWARALLKELKQDVSEPTQCVIDNAGVVKQAVSAVSHAQAKHYRVGQAQLRQKQDEREIMLTKVASEDNPADFFTKALDKGQFEKHRMFLMGQ